MDWKFSWALKDGSITPDCGRIVVYNGLGMKSNGSSMDHNDLLRAFASKYKIKKDEVISNAARFYWRPEKKGLITISPVRKIDEEYVYNKSREFERVIDEIF